MEFFSKIYEKRLEGIIKKNARSLPRHIVLIINETDLLESDFSSRIVEFINWCQAYHIQILTIYISLIDFNDNITDHVHSELMDQITLSIHNVDANIDFVSMEGKVHRVRRSADPLHINISLGYGGKKELTRAFRQIMAGIISGELQPEDIDEAQIEKHLLFRHEPDLVIRSGGKRLADFLIWQSVYSEIYFTDVSWFNLRKLDFLRAIRDFQQRQRRFGK